MNTIKGLPVSKWLGRYVKVELPGQGMSRVRFVGVHPKKGNACVELKVSGVTKTYPVEIKDIHPNWTENQDLFAEHTALGSKQDVGKVSVANALDQALGKALAQEKPPEPPPKPKAPEPPPAAQPPPPPAVSQRRIKNLIVGIDADPNWLPVFNDLQQLITNRAEYEAKVAKAVEELKLHDELIDLEVNDLKACRIEVVWEEGVPIPLPGTQCPPKQEPDKTEEFVIAKSRLPNTARVLELIESRQMNKRGHFTRQEIFELQNEMPLHTFKATFSALVAQGKIVNTGKWINPTGKHGGNTATYRLA